MVVYLVKLVDPKQNRIKIMKDKKQHKCKSFQLNGKFWRCQQCGKEKDSKSLQELLFEKTIQRLPQIVK